MNLDKGLHVKCFMRSTMVLEGIVEEWTEAHVVLKSLDGQNLMIVHKPAEDIMLTKVVLAEPEEIPAEKEVREPTNPRRQQSTKLQEQIKGKLQEALQPSGDIDLDKLNVKELRNLVLEQEKQIIAQKKQQHFGSGKVLKYNTPGSAYMPGKLPPSAKG